MKIEEFISTSWLGLPGLIWLLLILAFIIVILRYREIKFEYKGEKRHLKIHANPDNRPDDSEKIEETAPLPKIGTLKEPAKQLIE